VNYILSKIGSVGPMTTSHPYDVKSYWGCGAGSADFFLWETATGIDATKLSEPVR
jgi:hypothetical protein